jgi:uncharacterized protein
VSDFAHALPEGAAQRLDAQLASYAGGTSRQIAVAVFRSLEGESLEDVSMRLAEKWKIGGKAESDGVLVTLFLEEHKVRIEVGYGLEDKLPDAICARVIREVIAPRMRAGDLEGALRAAAATIDTQVTGRAHDDVAPPLPKRALGDARELTGFQLLKVLGTVGLMLLVLWLRYRSWRGGGFFGGGGASGDW